MMNSASDILFLFTFIAIIAIFSLLFYLLGQWWDRKGAQKQIKSVVNSLSSHERLAKEVRHEATVHRRIADEYREAFDKKEEYWKTVKHRWQEEAEKAKNIISQQEDLRTKHSNTLKEANRKLMALENEYQKTKRNSLTEITALKSSQGDDKLVKKLEAQANEADKKFTTEIEEKKKRLAELQASLRSAMRSLVS